MFFWTFDTFLCNMCNIYVFFLSGMLGLQYEDQNLARKSYHIIYTNDCVTVTFSRKILVFVL